MIKTLCFRVLHTFRVLCTGCMGSIPGRELPRVVRHGKEKKSISPAASLLPQHTNKQMHTQPSTSPPSAIHPHHTTHTHTHTHTHMALHLPTLCYTPTPHPSHPCTQCTSSGLSSFPVARSEQVWGGWLEGGGSSLAQALPPHIIIGDRIEYVGVQISRAVHLDIS